MLTFDRRYKLFIWKGGPPPIELDFSPSSGHWYTASPYIAYLLRDHADSEAAGALAPVIRRVERSSAAEPVLPPTNGLYDYQAAGVEHLVDQFRTGRRHLLLADDPGVGKSAQSLVTAKELGAARLLIVCPAGLRLNWLREVNTWHGGPAMPLLEGKTTVSPKGSIITSYNLVEKAIGRAYDFLIVDECHALREDSTARTKAILGDATRGWRGLVDTLPTLFLSGTPIPNGRPSELWPILYRCATDAIGYLKYSAFCARYCLMAPDGRGGFMVRGAKRQDELYARLRGSGFMTRRLKADVLHELPPKRYKMVVFPADGTMRKILNKESAFSAAEILTHGVPVGSPLPEIWREMGLAKVSAAVEYIKDLLAAEDKAVVFAHHVEVVALLVDALKEYGARSITGSTLPATRQAAVDAFQGDASCRVLVCNIVAGGTGTTLTAGHDVVFVESSWVPGENEQAEDREHRIGQKFAVIVHQLVVEGSLDAKILGSAAHKRRDVGGVLDGSARVPDGPRG